MGRKKMKRKKWEEKKKMGKGEDRREKENEIREKGENKWEERKRMESGKYEKERKKMTQGIRKRNGKRDYDKREDN